MFELKKEEYGRIAHLVKSENELSVFSVINGVMPGEIYVNSLDNPTAALVKTSECNFITGCSEDALFNSEVSEELDFWEQLTPDTNDWIRYIPTIHRNPFVRQYTRRHYVLSENNFKVCNIPLKEGFVLEKVDIDIVRQNALENSEKLLDWVENWGEDEKFNQYGAGFYIHNGKVIVSWSLSDCSFDKKIAIGIHTDERYRKNGFGINVVSATIQDCFRKGYEQIDWLCVDTNLGSRTIAENLGFTYRNEYVSFTSYPPIENINDLSEAEWFEWGEYLENASKTESSLIWECLSCYIKSNNLEKAIHMIVTMEQNHIGIDYLRYKNFISYLQGYGLCSHFNDPTWIDFICKRIPC